MDPPTVQVKEEKRIMVNQTNQMPTWEEQQQHTTSNYLATVTLHSV